MLGMGGGSRGGAGNDVAAGALAAFNSTSPNFAPQGSTQVEANPALAPKGQQGTGQQPDQLEQMINKLLGVWADRQKAQTEGPSSGQVPTAQPSPAAQPTPQQTQDNWGPYTVPIPQQFQHYFQPGTAQNG